MVSGDDIRLVPIVAIRGKVSYIKGKGLVRSDTGKPSSALRVIPLPGSPRTGEEDPTWPVFAAAGAEGHPTFGTGCPRRRLNRPQSWSSSGATGVGRYGALGRA
jgi:hypothetical protein